MDREYYRPLQPSVARAYHLSYDEAERITVGEQGYFWKESTAALEGADMSIKQFRLSAQAKEQLIRLKTRTGISPVEHPVPLGVLPVAAAAVAADAHRGPRRTATSR